MKNLLNGAVLYREKQNEGFAEKVPRFWGFTKEETERLVNKANSEPFPGDSLHPKWHEGGRVHNWHNYAQPALQAVWETFTPIQKKIIALTLDEIASQEQWE